MSFRPENEGRGGRPATPLEGEALEDKRSPARERRRYPVAPVTLGLLLVALVIGGLLLWFSYGDRAGGTEIFEESVESGTEPIIHITNGRGKVRVRGVEGLETIEISARRYARGFNPTSAKENAAEVPVEVSNEAEVEVSSDGGGGTGVDFDLEVPPGSTVEVESKMGDVEVSGLDGDVAVRGESGDVSLEDIQGSVSIAADQGDVSAETVNTKTGSAEVTVGSGDMNLKDLVIGILEARVESGDVALSGRFSGSGSILVETGSIDVRLPSEDVKDLDLETRVGEVVRYDEQEAE